MPYALYNAIRLAAMPCCSRARYTIVNTQQECNASRLYQPMTKIADGL